jgi:hypothetical protein
VTAFYSSHQPLQRLLLSRKNEEKSMSIAIGDKLPAATFKEKTADGPVEISTDELFAGRRIVLFAVPGAFTPTCSLNHLPRKPGHDPRQGHRRYRRGRRQ